MPDVQPSYVVFDGVLVSGTLTEIWVIVFSEKGVIGLPYDDLDDGRLWILWKMAVSLSLPMASIMWVAGDGVRLSFRVVMWM